MPIKMGAYLSQKDVYIEYEFEDVLFRRMHDTGLIFRKFYGEDEAENPIPYTNRLYNDALLYGEEITRNEYIAK